MATEIHAPAFPESIQDGTIATWHKQVGQACQRDEIIADIETDKVVMEVTAPADGVLTQIVKAEGDTVLSKELIAIFEAGASAAVQAPAPAAVASAPPAMQAAAAAGPAARKAAAERGVDTAQIAGTGKGGRVTKQDVLAATPVVTSSVSPAVAASVPPLVPGERIEKRVAMTRMRTRIAERLLEAKQSTAMLTTFNEVNMAPIMALRKQYGEKFEKAHGVRLGFMSFFIKAAVEALKRYPAVNASIDGQDIVYHGYQDIGVAVSSDKGLVVPILRDAEAMSLAEMEAKVGEYGRKAKDGKLSIEEMTGGTFSITNGGVFGSLLSTPILNPPQTAILGMHKIQERPMAVNGQVVILPMMYLALSYDHRLIDGKEAVSFLVAIKDLVEDPARLLLEI